SAPSSGRRGIPTPIGKSISSSIGRRSSRASRARTMPSASPGSPATRSPISPSARPTSPSSRTSPPEGFDEPHRGQKKSAAPGGARAPSYAARPVPRGRSGRPLLGTQHRGVAHGLLVLGLALDARESADDAGDRAEQRGDEEPPRRGRADVGRSRRGLLTGGL